MVMIEKKMLSPFNRLSKQSRQKTIQARYIVFATLIALLVITLITTNQSSTSVRSSLRALEVQPTNATILPDIREVLDLVEDKSGSGSSDEVVSEFPEHEEAAGSPDKVSSQAAGATNVHEEDTDSLEEVSSQVATADRDDDKDDDDTKSTTDITTGNTLQERLLARSIEVREMISETLSEAAAHIPSPQYFHFNPYEKERPATDHSCDQEDAYAGIAVDGWMPPQFGYPMESLNEWYSEYEVSMKKIKSKDAGGSGLRDFAAKENQKLRELRHSLFCEDQRT